MCRKLLEERLFVRELRSAPWDHRGDALPVSARQGVRADAASRRSAPTYGEDALNDHAIFCIVTSMRCRFTPCFCHDGCRQTIAQAVLTGIDSLTKIDSNFSQFANKR
ncbi:hypothetical protein [Bradyrhizobium sp. CCGB20]|uniref:hypothetical protein n=1 Tax=Bradyrhizobium sp. CCGB20 TaxID=2949633 RepID=UPI0020B2245A|nr:hypothetical protein [Bradyrhizobium sp. CCGB20]MCP3396097.1 hypothetical protein [Bradyrhizobium sp. CCGB20]